MATDICKIGSRFEGECPNHGHVEGTMVEGQFPTTDGDGIVCTGDLGIGD